MNAFSQHEPVAQLELGSSCETALDGHAAVNPFETKPIVCDIRWSSAAAGE